MPQLHFTRTCWAEAPPVWGASDDRYTPMSQTWVWSAIPLTSCIIMRMTMLMHKASRPPTPALSGSPQRDSGLQILAAAMAKKRVFRPYAHMCIQRPDVSWHWAALQACPALPQPVMKHEAPPASQQVS
jgi:hypothetical protein